MPCGVVGVMLQIQSGVRSVRSSGGADLKQERHVLLAQRARELLGRGEAVRDQPHLRRAGGGR